MAYDSDRGYGGGGGYSRGPREMFEAVCSECGGVARVPFQPSGDKPVYCSNCFEQPAQLPLSTRSRRRSRRPLHVAG